MAAETAVQPERLLSVKSKFDAEFRRFAISTSKMNYEHFDAKVCFDFETP